MNSLTNIHFQVRELEFMLQNQPGIQDAVVVAEKVDEVQYHFHVFIEPKEAQCPNRESILGLWDKTNITPKPSAIVFGPIHRTPTGKVSRKSLQPFINKAG